MYENFKSLLFTRNVLLISLFLCWVTQALSIFMLGIVFKTTVRSHSSFVIKAPGPRKTTLSYAVNNSVINLVNE